MVSRDSKEYLLRLQRINEDANKKLANLDNAINDVQNWEKRLCELKDWLAYIDKYLTTRIEKDIFADDVPDDAARLVEEFNQHEQILKELERQVESYKVQNKIDAAYRLEQQLNIVHRSWNDVNLKLKKFQKPSDFDVKLQKMKKSLDEIDSTLHTIDVYNEDADVIHLQLEHCMVMHIYK